MPISGPYSSNQSHRVIELLRNLDQKARSKVNFWNQIVLLLSSSLGSYMNKDIDNLNLVFFSFHWKLHIGIGKLSKTQYSKETVSFLAL